MIRNDTTSTRPPDSRRTTLDRSAVLEIATDPYARSILITAMDEPVTIDELVKICDRSQSTIYRRVGELREQRLLEKLVSVGPTNRRPSWYQTTFNELTITVHADGIEADIETACATDIEPNRSIDETISWYLIGLLLTTWTIAEFCRNGIISDVFLRYSGSLRYSFPGHWLVWCIGRGPRPVRSR